MTTAPSARKFVLLTGAAGRIGSAFRAETGERYRFRLADRVTDGLTGTPGEGHETVSLDVADLDACRAACRGVDTVIHLAADPSPEADFYGSLLENNIKGTYNVLQAAEAAECRRVIVASSIHAVIGYPVEQPVPTDAPVWPVNMYGVSKCFGEAAAARFASNGLSCIAVRIGFYGGNPSAQSELGDEDRRTFVSIRDLNQLLERCVEANDVRFAIVHGVSDNHPQRLDLTSTRELLGYAPKDDAFRAP